MSSSHESGKIFAAHIFPLDAVVADVAVDRLPLLFEAQEERVVFDDGAVAGRAKAHIFPIDAHLEIDVTGALDIPGLKGGAGDGHIVFLIAEDDEPGAGIAGASGLRGFFARLKRAIHPDLNAEIAVDLLRDARAVHHVVFRGQIVGAFRARHGDLYAADQLRKMAIAILIGRRPPAGNNPEIGGRPIADRRVGRAHAGNRQSRQ